MDSRTEEAVRQRARDSCEYCGLHQKFSVLSFHTEHIIARQHGGSDHPANLAFACPECNLRKGPNVATIDPVSGELVRLYDPRKDRWTDHFQVNAGFIEGRTAVGRGTTALLEFNAKDRVRLRRVIARIPS